MAFYPLTHRGCAVFKVREGEDMGQAAKVFYVPWLTKVRETIEFRTTLYVDSVGKPKLWFI